MIKLNVMFLNADHGYIIVSNDVYDAVDDNIYYKQHSYRTAVMDYFLEIW